MHVNVKFKFALNACMDAPQEEWSAYGYYNNKLLIIIIIISPDPSVSVPHHIYYYACIILIVDPYIDQSIISTESETNGKRQS